MTVKLLLDWPDSRDGRQYRAGNLLTTDAGTEAGLIAANMATSNLAGGTNYIQPVTAVAPRPNFGTNRRGFPLAANITSGSGLSFAYQSGSANHSVTYITRDGMRGVRIQTDVGYWAEVSVPTFSKVISKGQVETLTYVPDGQVANVSSLTLYVGDSASYTNSFSTSIPFTSSGCNQHPGYLIFAPDPAGVDSGRIQWAVLQGTPVWSSTTMTNSKLRITPTAGKSAVVEVFYFMANGYNTLPKVVFTADDGYDSVYNVGVPVLEKYGHRLSMGIIADKVGTSSYMTLGNLQELVGRGHECVVHGPTGGNGSLVDNYTTTAQVLSDVLYHRDFLVNNNLARNGSEKIYVFPQGKYIAARDDNTVLNAINQAGFVAARQASVNQSAIVMADAGKLPLFIPIIGHTNAGASEAANITTLITKIQEAATQGRSVVLMFHKFMTSATTQPLEIQNSNLELICQAVADLETAGTMRNALLTELVAELQAPQ